MLYDYARYRSGSPPRAWGQSTALRDYQTFIRFTPTGVGTIATTSRRSTWKTVHPHGRGDNANTSLAIGWMNGSPPRAWGQCQYIISNRLDERFTPTGVGTMPRCQTATSATAVHPHGRGDNCVPALARKVHCGSPPRAWGQCRLRRCRRRPRRFTPTGVGTMQRCWKQVKTLVGSPLRAWGQFTGANHQHLVLRFTPTGVGTISAMCDGGAYYAVHPHGRGDNCRDIYHCPPDAGSPPRAWGQ